MIIRSSSQLRDNYKEITSLVRSGETVFLTHNGAADMVVISKQKYDRMTNELKLYQHLAEGENDIAAGRTQDNDAVYANIMKILEKKQEI